MLGGQHPGHGEKQATDELIAHHYQRRVYPEHCQKNWPQKMKLMIEKSVRLGFWDHSAPQAPQLPHQPCIKCQSDDAMFHQQLQISVMRIQHFLFVSADVTRQRRRHLVHSPPCKWPLQKHLPTSQINRLAKIHWATLFQPVGEALLQIVTAQYDKQ